MIEDLSRWSMEGTRYTLPTNNVLQVTSQERCDPATWGLFKDVSLSSDFSIDFEFYDWTQATGFTLSHGHPVFIYMSGGGFVALTTAVDNMESRIWFVSNLGSTFVLGSNMKRYCRISRVGSSVHFDRWASADRVGDPDRSTLDVDTDLVETVVLGRGLGATATCNYYATYKVANVVLPRVGGATQQWW